MRSDTVRHAHGPTMHKIGSISGKRKAKRMGYDDKGSGRNSSMGRSHARGGRFR